jgi:DNA (cytosine-5)-methyltransferase 1
MKTISLFTGAGGLDLGLEAAGFDTRICVECDADARETLHTNRPHWRLLEPGDIHASSPDEVLSQARLKRGEAALLAAGPPCQPFSKAAYWANGDTQRLADPRAKTLMAFLRVAEAALPQVVLMENVDGLSYSGKREGLDFLLHGIEQINRRFGTRYYPGVFRLNSAELGVPQIRERTYLVADKDGRVFAPPCRTHGPPEGDEGVEPYFTAWDAIGDLDSPDWDRSLEPRGKWAGLLPSIPEGRNYLWHTPGQGGVPLFGWRTRFWSFLLKLAKGRPSWTVSAHPGPATGPFHWRNRMLSGQELSRIQTFPDDYLVSGRRSSVQRQVGNAVPPLVAEVIGREIRHQLLSTPPRGNLRYLPMRRGDCPQPAPPHAPPQQYLRLAGHHAAHPGTGRGPRAVRRASGPS